MKTLFIKALSMYIRYWYMYHSEVKGKGKLHVVLKSHWALSTHSIISEHILETPSFTLQTCAVFCRAECQIIKAECLTLPYL